MQDLVTYRLEDSIARITLDDGKVNVMSPTMQGQLNAALDRAITDKATVLLTGRPGVFSAGFDLPILTAGGQAASDMVRGGFELSLRLLSFPAPVVIACTGHALAMGAFLVLSADYRVGAMGPFKIGANEVAIGLTMPHFAIELSKLRLSPAYFQRAMLTAEIFSPENAAVAGFLDHVVDADSLAAVAMDKAHQFLKLNMAAHAATKLRVRGPALAALRDAIGTDDSAFRARK